MAGIKSMEVAVNGEWILMSYDPKLRQIWSEKKTDESVFSGELSLIMEDNAGNISTYKTLIQ